MLLRALVIVAWLAIAFVLPPILGRSSVGSEVDPGASAGAPDAFEPAAMQPEEIRASE